MSFLCKWFGIGCPKPEPPSPPTPTPPSLRAVGVIVPGIAGATVRLDNVGGPFLGVTNNDGYLCFLEVPTALSASHLWVNANGYKDYSVHVDLPPQNVDLVVGGTAHPDQIQLPALTLAAPPRRSQQALTQIRANFCNLTDSADRIIFTADYLGTDAGTRQDWTKRLVDAGSTHLVVSPTGGDYPGSPIGRFNLYDTPEQFASEVRAILNTPSADGLALTPILILDSGASGIRQRIDQYWGPIREALGDDEKDCIVVPGWELIRASDATSADFSYALEKLHHDGWSHIWAHLSPGRAAFSSNPIERDDPWQGGESECWKTHGGQYVEGLLYQSEAVRPDDDKCDPANDDCWLNRWEDVVPRLGAGMNGWRIVHLCYFEGPAYYYYRRQSDSAFARRIATAAKKLATKYGVTIGFGNGLPY
jgi:hypothetical protein